MLHECPQPVGVRVTKHETGSSVSRTAESGIGAVNEAKEARWAGAL